MKKALEIIYLVLLIGFIIFSACSKATSPQYRVDKSACSGCGTCIDVCPFNAIEILENGKAVIDQSECTQCGKCLDNCPEGAIN